MKLSGKTESPRFAMHHFEHRFAAINGDIGLFSAIFMSLLLLSASARRLGILVLLGLPLPLLSSGTHLRIDVEASPENVYLITIV